MQPQIFITWINRYIKREIKILTLPVTVSSKQYNYSNKLSNYYKNRGNIIQVTRKLRVNKTLDLGIGNVVEVQIHPTKIDG